MARRGPGGRPVEDVAVDTAPKRSSRVLAERTEEETILLALDGGHYFSLNEVGTRVWELCDGTHDVADIVTLLCDEYDAPHSTVEADVVDLVRALARDHLLDA